MAGRCSIAIAQQGVVTEQESISEEAVRLLYNSTRSRKNKNYNVIIKARALWLKWQEDVLEEAAEQ